MRRKSIFHTSSSQNKAGGVIQISDRIYFKSSFTRDKEGHTITIKDVIQQNHIRRFDIYVSKNRSSNQKLTEVNGGIDSSAIIFGEFNIHSKMIITTRQKI